MRDWQSEYGYNPTWDEQRKKQEEHAREIEARLHGELITLEDLEDEEDESR